MFGSRITQNNKISKLENLKRNEQVYNLRSKGFTYEEIGRRFSPKLSRQRIHQIVVRHAKRLGVRVENLKEVK
jgi:hypothetical protein